MTHSKILIANWKMKPGLKDSIDLAKKIKEKIKKKPGVGVAVCPNHIALHGVSKVLGKSAIKLGAQDVFWEEQGSYTGEISAAMIKEAGCGYVIVGHSERRKYLNENYEMIHQKTKAVLNLGGLIPVVCIGEEAKDRDSGKKDYVLMDQLHQAFGGINLMENQEVIVAYEPVWAIGTGTPIKPEEAEYAHKIVKITLLDIFGSDLPKKNYKIIYGGSISGSNVKDFVKLDNIDGFLVGGAGLKPVDFAKIFKAMG